MYCEIIMDFKVLLLMAMCVTVTMSSSKKRTTKKELKKYPKDTEFWVTDFFTHGCKNFLTNCPRSYKSQIVCGRDYNGNFKDFGNFCEMQYENCNTWNHNWKIYKRAKC